VPWKRDARDAYFLDPRPGLSGYPGKPKKSPAKPRPEIMPLGLLKGAEGEHLVSHGRVEQHLTVWEWPAASGFEPTWAVVQMSDRTGARYQRVVGLRDYITQEQAAKLLRAPVMSVTRWVRAGELPSRKRGGFAVIRLGDLLAFAKERKRPVRVARRLAVIRAKKEKSPRTKSELIAENRRLKEQLAASQRHAKAVFDWASRPTPARRGAGGETLSDSAPDTGGQPDDLEADQG
jgi:hypothetical protein